MSRKQQKAGVESYVVYRSKSGGKYHTRPACAVDSEISPNLDYGNSLFERLETHRVGDDCVNKENLCGTCASKIIKRL